MRTGQCHGMAAEAGRALALIILALPGCVALGGESSAPVPSDAPLPAVANRSSIASPDEALDALGKALGISAFQGEMQVQVSGLADLEGYAFSRPAPALIESSHDPLFDPRLSLFADLKIGQNLTGFLQARFDRGFDPSDQDLMARLDEYFLRYRLLHGQDYSLAAQAGKFATVVGNWTPRHLSWDNPFVNAPLPYENVTSVADTEGPDSPADFKTFRATPNEKYERVPVVWGPSYASGLALAGEVGGHYDFAFEVKNAALSSRPEAWDGTQRDWSYPTFSGRIGMRPKPDWNLGVSASRGAYLADTVVLSPGQSLGDYQQDTLGEDLAYAHGHLQVWAEAYESRFKVPNVGNADTLAYYAETKYKFTPSFWGGLRWNQQLFGDVPDGSGGEEAWGNDLWRTDVVAGYRASEHFQLKLQYSYGREHDPGGQQNSHLGAIQMTTRF